MRISGHRSRAMLDALNIVNERDLQEALTRVEHYIDEKRAEKPHTEAGHSACSFERTIVSCCGR